VPRLLIQLPFAEHGRVDVLIAVPAFELVHVVLDGLADGGAGGQPAGEAGADQRIGVEEAELTAEPAVVVHDHPLGGRGERPISPGVRPGSRDQRAGTGSGVVVT
jgi:hypothetical protein